MALLLAGSYFGVNQCNFDVVHCPNMTPRKAWFTLRPFGSTLAQATHGRLVVPFPKNQQASCCTCTAIETISCGAPQNFYVCQDADPVLEGAAHMPSSVDHGQYKPPCSTLVINPQSEATPGSPEPSAPVNPALSAALAKKSQSAHAGVVTQQNDNSTTLSPRASLDLSLHPDGGDVCIVKITADPGRDQYSKHCVDDSVIDDPTAVAFLERAFQPNMAHPVFHVHMPSRRTSQHGHDALLEPDLGTNQITAAHGVNGEDGLLQPLLSDTLGGQALALDEKTGERELDIWQRWRTLLGNPEAVPFFAMSLLMGFGTGTLSVYLFLYLDELGKWNVLMP